MSGRMTMLLLLAGVAAVVPAAGTVRADVLHLRTGGAIEGTVLRREGEVLVVRTRFGTQRIARADVVRIEKKETPEEILERRLAKLAPDDVAGHLALARWCKEQRMPRRYRELLERVVALDPRNETAQKGLGRVLYEGRWMTPREKGELEKRREIAGKRARGLVFYQGRWVTKEEREAREKGLVLHEGRWCTQDEVRRAQGLVRVKGAWVRRDALEHRREVEELDALLGVRLSLEDSEHFSIRSELPADHREELANELEKGYRLFHSTFRIDEDLLGGRALEVVEFLEGGAFRIFLGDFARRHGLAADWVRVAGRSQGVYHYAPPLIADCQAARPRAHLVNSAVNKLAKILANLLHFNYNDLPSWFEEGIGVWLEVEVRGNWTTYTRGGPATGARSRYGRREDVGKRFDPSRGWIPVAEWRETLRDAVEEGTDPPFEGILGRELPELSSLDVVKSWSVVRYLIRRDPARLDDFLRRIRRDLPRYGAHPTPRDRIEIQRRALEAVYGERVLALESEWKGSLKR